MRRRPIDNIQIQQPPMQELKKGRSCAKRTCCTGCGCAVLFIVIALLVLHILLFPRPKTIVAIPDSFPTDVPIYAANDVHDIVFFSNEKQQQRSATLAYAPERTRGIFQKIIGGASTSTTQIAQHHIQITWVKLPVDAPYLISFYETELKKAGFTARTSKDASGAMQLIFEHTEARGTLTAQDTSNNGQIDTATLDIYYTPKQP